MEINGVQIKVKRRSRLGESCA